MAPVKISHGKAGNAKTKRNSGKASKPKSTKISQKFNNPPTVQQKTKSNTGLTRKKRKVYTDKELAIPKLNMITPAGVEQPRGKKKDKVFVDDQESMMTILAIVNADKEGQIESKMMKSRQMEEIREARRREMEARQGEKKAKLEETKDSLRRKRRRKSQSLLTEPSLENGEAVKIAKSTEAGQKRVSFGK